MLEYLKGGTHSVMVIVIGNGFSDRVQILNQVVCISHPCEKYVSNYSSPVMGK